MKLWAAIDIDGVVADCSWRREHALEARASSLPQSVRDRHWRDFHSKCGQDPLFIGEAMLVTQWAKAGNEVVYITGRPDYVRRDTLVWFAKHGLPEGYLLMRPEGTTARSSDFKRRMYVHARTELMGKEDYMAFAMDDNDHVVAMWRSLGITCLQPRHCDY